VPRCPKKNLAKKKNCQEDVKEEKKERRMSVKNCQWQLNSFCQYCTEDASKNIKWPKRVKVAPKCSTKKRSSSMKPSNSESTKKGIPMSSSTPSSGPGAIQSGTDCGRK
jgi:hypothetical protein